MKPLRVDHFNKFVSNICYTSTQMIKMLNWAGNSHFFAYDQAVRHRQKPETPVHKYSSTQLLEVRRERRRC